jgi:hypothetical protein
MMVTVYLQGCLASSSDRFNCLMGCSRFTSTCIQRKHLQQATSTDSTSNCDVLQLTPALSRQPVQPSPVHRQGYFFQGGLFSPTQGPAGPTISGRRSSIFVTPQFRIEFVISSAITTYISAIPQALQVHPYRWTTTPIGDGSGA